MNGLDILSLNTFLIISGYYTALECTLFVKNLDQPILAIWQANIGTQELGISVLKPRETCAEVTDKVHAFLKKSGMLQYRAFGYGHSFGVMSYYYGREAELEVCDYIDAGLEPGIVILIELMLTLPHSAKGAGVYRENDILLITNNGVSICA